MNGGGVFCRIQTVIKNVLRNVEKYPTYGIHECIKRDRKYQNYILRKVRHYPNGYLEFTNILKEVENQSKN